jgi:hypothetical protein
MVAPPYGLLAPARGGSKDFARIDRLKYYNRFFKEVKTENCKNTMFFACGQSAFVLSYSYGEEVLKQCE